MVRFSRCRVDIQQGEAEVYYRGESGISCGAVILLNKVELISDEEKSRIRGIIRKLNPDARLIETTYSVVDVRFVITVIAVVAIVQWGTP